MSQTDSVYRALALVAAGIGHALVPGHFEVASVKQVPVTDLNISRTIGLIWPRERKNGALKEFLTFAESHCWTAQELASRRCNVAKDTGHREPETTSGSPSTRSTAPKIPA